MYVRVPVPDPELPTSLKSRRPIPSVTVTKTVPPERKQRLTCALLGTLGDLGATQTRGHGDPATKFPPAENSSLAPGRKKILFISPRTSCAPAIPGRSLTPQSDHAPLFEYIDAPSGPSESSHTCRSWQRAVGPNVCILREAGLDARANAVASSPTLPFGLPQAIATRRL